MDVTNILALLRSGDIAGVLDLLTWDEQEAITDPSSGSMVGIGRMGALQVAMLSDGRVLLHGHDTVEACQSCYARQVSMLREAAAALSGGIPPEIRQLMEAVQGRGVTLAQAAAPSSRFGFMA